MTPPHSGEGSGEGVSGALFSAVREVHERLYLRDPPSPALSLTHTHTHTTLTQTRTENACTHSRVGDDAHRRGEVIHSPKGLLQALEVKGMGGEAREDF
jgi:hypothetical protein